MDVTSKFNYYDILELSPQAQQHEVTISYERLKMTYNGDNPAVYTIFSSDESRAMLSLVEEAYSIIGNKGLRHQYDETLNLSSAKGNDSSPAPYSAPMSSMRARNIQDSKKSIFQKPEFKVKPEIEKEIADCEEWNGAMLKKVREYKNWRVEDLAVLTKISGYYITAAEKEDPKNLPAPVFVRGYISQLCKVYGLDEKRVCDSYMKVFKTKLENK